MNNTGERGRAATVPRYATADTIALHWFQCNTIQYKFNYSIHALLLSSGINFVHFKINGFIKIIAQYELSSRVLWIQYSYSLNVSEISSFLLKYNCINAKYVSFDLNRKSFDPSLVDIIEEVPSILCLLILSTYLYGELISNHFNFH